MDKLILFLLRIGLSFVMTLLLLLLFQAPRDGVLSFLMILDMTAKDKPTWYKSLTPEPAVLSDSIPTKDGRYVRFDLYATGAKRPAAGMIVTHGFTEKGKNDKRLQSMAKRLARAGFVIMVPDLVQMRNFRLSFQDVEEITLCFNHFRQRPEVDPEKIGLVGFSFGTGPVIIAMTRPELQERIKFGVFFGGYYDLKRALKYTLTGAYDAEGYDGQVEMESKSDRWEFLLGNASLIESDGTFENVIQKKIEDPFYDLSSDAMWLTQEQNDMLAFIGNEDPFLFDELYDRTPQNFKTWIDTLSLYHYSDKIQAQLIIGHSEGDHVVHFTESLTLANQVPGAPQPFVAIMGLFTHVNLRVDWESLPAVFDETLPGLYDLWQLTYHVLQQRL